MKIPSCFHSHRIKCRHSCQEKLNIFLRRESPLIFGLNKAPSLDVLSLTSFCFLLIYFRSCKRSLSDAKLPLVDFPPLSCARLLSVLFDLSTSLRSCKRSLSDAKTSSRRLPCALLRQTSSRRLPYDDCFDFPMKACDVCVTIRSIL